MSSTGAVSLKPSRSLKMLDDRAAAIMRATDAAERALEASAAVGDDLAETRLRIAAVTRMLIDKKKKRAEDPAALYPARLVDSLREGALTRPMTAREERAVLKSAEQLASPSSASSSASASAAVQASSSAASSSAASVSGGGSIRDTASVRSSRVSAAMADSASLAPSAATSASARRRGVLRSGANASGGAAGGAVPDTVVKKLGSTKMTLSQMKLHYVFPYNAIDTGEIARDFPPAQQRLYRIKQPIIDDAQPQQQEQEQQQQQQSIPVRGSRGGASADGRSFGRGSRADGGQSGSGSASGNSGRAPPSPSGSHKSGASFSRGTQSIATRSLFGGSMSTMSAAQTLAERNRLDLRFSEDSDDESDRDRDRDGDDYSERRSESAPDNASSASSRSGSSATRATSNKEEAQASVLPQPVRKAEYLSPVFGATRAGADLVLLERYIDAAREIYHDPGHVPLVMRAVEGDMLEIQMDFLDKVDIAALLAVDVSDSSARGTAATILANRNYAASMDTALAGSGNATVRASQSRGNVTFNLDGDVSSPLQTQAQQRAQPVQPMRMTDALAATQKANAEALLKATKEALADPAVVRVCIALAHLLFWTVLRPRYDSSLNALVDAKERADAAQAAKDAEEAAAFAEREAMRAKAQSRPAVYDLSGGSTPATRSAAGTRAGRRGSIGSVGSGGSANSRLNSPSGGAFSPMQFPRLPVRHTPASILGLSDEAMDIALHASAPPSDALAAALVDEYSRLEVKVAHIKGLTGANTVTTLTRTRPVLLLAIRTCTEAYMRARYPLHFLLEAGVAEYLRRYPVLAQEDEPLSPPPVQRRQKKGLQRRGSVTLGTAPVIASTLSPLTRHLISKTATHRQLDALVAGIFDPSRWGSHIPSLESSAQARKQAMLAKVETRKAMLRTRTHKRAMASSLSAASASASATSQQPRPSPVKKPAIKPMSESAARSLPPMLYFNSSFRSNMDGDDEILSEDFRDGASSVFSDDDARSRASPASPLPSLPSSPLAGAQRSTRSFFGSRQHQQPSSSSSHADVSTTLLAAHSSEDAAPSFLKSGSGYAMATRQLLYTTSFAVRELMDREPPVEPRVRQLRSILEKSTFTTSIGPGSSARSSPIKASASTMMRTRSHQSEKKDTTVSPAQVAVHNSLVKASLLRFIDRYESGRGVRTGDAHHRLRVLQHLVGKVGGGASAAFDAHAVASAATASYEPGSTEVSNMRNHDLSLDSVLSGEWTRIASLQQASTAEIDSAPPAAEAAAPEVAAKGTWTGLSTPPETAAERRARIEANAETAVRDLSRNGRLVRSPFVADQSELADASAGKVTGRINLQALSSSQQLLFTPISRAALGLQAEAPRLTAMKVASIIHPP
jgi:hypothetical protein